MWPTNELLGKQLESCAAMAGARRGIADYQERTAQINPNERLVLRYANKSIAFYAGQFPRIVRISVRSRQAPPSPPGGFVCFGMVTGANDNGGGWVIRLVTRLRIQNASPARGEPKRDLGDDRNPS